MKPVFAALLLLSLGGCASVEHGSRARLVGHWRYADRQQSCDYAFERNGSFTGEVQFQKRIVSRFNGRWSLRGDALLYTYLSDAFGRIPPGTTDRDQILEIKERSFLIRAANGEQRRYQRLR
jgi:hypothetical protein